MENKIKRYSDFVNESNKQNDTFTIKVKYEVGSCDIDTKGILLSALQKTYNGYSDKVILDRNNLKYTVKNSEVELYQIDSRYDEETFKVVFNQYNDEYDTKDNEDDIYNLVTRSIKSITYYTYRSVYKMDEKQKTDIKILDITKI